MAKVSEMYVRHRGTAQLGNLNCPIPPIGLPCKFYSYCTSNSVTYMLFIYNYKMYFTPVFFYKKNLLIVNCMSFNF